MSAGSKGMSIVKLYLMRSYVCVNVQHIDNGEKWNTPSLVEDFIRKKGIETFLSSGETTVATGVCQKRLQLLVQAQTNFTHLNRLPNAALRSRSEISGRKEKTRCLAFHRTALPQITQRISDYPPCSYVLENLTRGSPSY